MPYDPEEARLEDIERAALHDNRAALDTPIVPGQSDAYLNRTRATADALVAARCKLEDYRHHRALAATPHYFIEA